MASLKNREIEMEVGEHVVIYHLQSSFFNQKHAFNIFCVAFISHGCGIRLPLMWHLSVTDAT